MGCGVSAEDKKEPATKPKSGHRDKQKGKNFDTPVPDNSGTKPDTKASPKGKSRKDMAKWYRSEGHVDVTAQGMKLVKSTWEDAQKWADESGKPLGEQIFAELDTPGNAGAVITGMNRTAASLGTRFEKKFTEFIEVVSGIPGVPHEERTALLAPIVAIAKSHVKHGLIEYHYTALWKAVQACVKSSQAAGQSTKAMDSQVKHAWRALFSYLSRILVSHHRKEAGEGTRHPGLDKAWGEEAKLLQYSFVQLNIGPAGVPEDVSRAYYTHLYHKAAHLRQVFEETDGESACGLFRCLKDVVDNLPNPLPVEELQEVGMRHSLYGVKPRDYTISCEALIEIIPTVSPDTPVSRAWEALFRRFRFLMSHGVEPRRDSDPDEFDYTHGASPKAQGETRGSEEVKSSEGEANQNDTIPQIDVMEDAIAALCSLSPDSEALELLQNSRKP